MEKAQSSFDVFGMQVEIRKTVANSTRLRILRVLREGEKSVGEILMRSEKCVWGTYRYPRVKTVECFSAPLYNAASTDFDD